MMIEDLPEFDWTRIAGDLNASGYAELGPVLGADDCARLIDAYEDDTKYRSRVVMSRHGFGQGEYKYFSYPLPDRIGSLRAALYPGLSGIANAWQEKLGLEDRYPGTLDELLALCHQGGQPRPTPLILKYGPGDYNCLHQDLYGALMFPIQVVILLSHQEDFEGGEFVLTEQRPRMQSRAEVVPLRQGRAVAFAVNERPKEGKRGYYRVKQRHGVSRLRSGHRHTLGIIFHDAA